MSMCDCNQGRLPCGCKQPALAVVPFDLEQFARAAAREMEKHDFLGFEPVVYAVVEQLLAAPVPAAQDDSDNILMGEPRPRQTAEVPRSELQRLFKALGLHGAVEHGRIVSRAADRLEAEQVPVASGLELAARWVEQRLMDYEADHGFTDPDTGTREYPGNGDEYVYELQEIADGIRAQAPPAAPAQDEIARLHTILRSCLPFVQRRYDDTEGGDASARTTLEWLESTLKGGKAPAQDVRALAAAEHAGYKRAMKEVAAHYVKFDGQPGKVSLWALARISAALDGNTWAEVERSLEALVSRGIVKCWKPGFYSLPEYTKPGGAQ